MQVEDVLQSLTEQAQAGAKTVYGDPIRADGKIIVPMADVRYGFGMGRGKRKSPSDEGVGGGGGFLAKPAGVIEITAAETRVIPFRNWKRFAAALGLGFAAGVVFSRRRSRARERAATRNE